MSEKRVVTLLKNGNVMTVHPTDDRIFTALEPLLSFKEPIAYRGLEAIQRKNMGLPQYETVRHTLFTLDGHKRVVAPFGFWKLIRDELRKIGYEVKLRDLHPPDPSKFEPQWDRIADFKLRDHQPEFLEKLLTSRCGRFDCPPGFGKSFMIGLVAALLPNATIDVVTKRVAVLRDRIYPELVQMVGDVGIMGGGKNIKGRRVMCYTVGSMSYSPATADILICDEVHELAADGASGELVRWKHSRNCGMSASHDMRWDGKDLRMHGVFGPIIFKVDYQQAQNSNMVVPIKVLWTDVLTANPAIAFKKDIEKKRHGIWINDARNDAIANDARKYDDDTQVLITVDTLQHAMHLKKRLPEYTLVYMENGLSYKDRKQYADQGCCEPDEPMMDLDRRQRLTKDFESGKLKKAICTTVWNVGVSFNKLQVLIRGGAGGSSINDIQIPGRVSRVADGKDCSVVHDYLDQFDGLFQRQAKSRESSYKRNGWEQVYPKSNKNYRPNKE